MQKFIADHTKSLSYIVAIIIAIWYVTGLLVVDFINPVVYVAIWIPIGLIAAFFAYRW